MGPQAAIFLPCSFVRCLAYIENGRQKNFRDFYSPQAVFEMRARGADYSEFLESFENIFFRILSVIFSIIL